MAKKNGNIVSIAEVKDEFEEEEEAVEVEEVEVKKAPKVIDREKLTALFGQYEKHESSIERAKEAVEKAVAARSDIVRQILEVGGNKKIRYKGNERTIVKKHNKSTDTDTYFFRGVNKDEDALEID